MSPRVAPQLPRDALGRHISAMPVSRAIARYRALTGMRLASVFKIYRHQEDTAFRVQLYYIARGAKWTPPTLAHNTTQNI